MSIRVVSINKIKQSQCDIFTDVIYNNFIHLKNEKQLKHSRKDIYEIFTSKNPQIYLFLVNNKIASYLVGEIIQLNDGRNVLYITYLFTSPKFRESGFGSKLMNVAESIVYKGKIDGIMLTCNSEDPYIYDFYMKKGFMPDLILRTYDKYEVMYKAIY